MTSEEFRTNPLLLRNQFERSGTFEIPVIRKEEIDLENLSLIGYDKLSSEMVIKSSISFWMTTNLRCSGTILNRGSKDFLLSEQSCLHSSASILRCPLQSKSITLSGVTGVEHISKVRGLK